MSKNGKTAKEYMILVLAILLVSLTLNIFTSINNYKIKYRVGKESYSSIEHIRINNENNMTILEKSIEVGYLTNMELLQLYKNYSDISSNIIKLWDEYSFYANNKPLFNLKKKLDTDKNILNDINNNIEDSLLFILNNQMENQSYRLYLNENKLLNKFNGMKELSDKVNNYYIDFYDKYLIDVIDEDKVKKIIKEHYWIDILEGIYSINDEYKNYDFVLEQ